MFSSTSFSGSRKNYVTSDSPKVKTPMQSKCSELIQDIEGSHNSPDKDSPTVTHIGQEWLCGGLTPGCDMLDRILPARPCLDLVGWKTAVSTSVHPINVPRRYHLRDWNDLCRKELLWSLLASTKEPVGLFFCKKEGNKEGMDFTGGAKRLPGPPYCPWFSTCACHLPVLLKLGQSYFT